MAASERGRVDITHSEIRVEGKLVQIRKESLVTQGGTHTPNVSSPETSFKETHRSMDSDGSDDSFSPLRGVRASSPLRGARAPSPLARQWILGATPIGDDS